MKLLNKLLSKLGYKAVKKDAVVLGDNEITALKVLFANIEVKLWTESKEVKHDMGGIVQNVTGDIIILVSEIKYTNMLKLNLKQSEFTFKNDTATGIQNLIHYSL